MKKIRTMADVLDFAIAGENESAELYMRMAAMVENPWMQKTLEGLAQEELQHRRTLKAVKVGRRALSREDAGDLGIVETLEDVKPHADMDYRELLVFAIKKENVAHNLYMRMAVIFPEPELQDTFLKLAKEEAEHKRRFEMEYESLTS
ncbi:MAG: ferritin family protein [Sedimentisphaerales bacterium]|nr:ferritin family protein [Sedimentisphaerales bacterium]